MNIELEKSDEKFWRSIYRTNFNLVEMSRGFEWMKLVLPRLVGHSERRQYFNDYYLKYREQPTRTITIPYDLIGILEYIINNKLNLKETHQLLNDKSTSFEGIDGNFSFKKNIISRKLNVLKISNGKANLVK